jgi:hypothetical protein
MFATLFCRSTLVSVIVSGACMSFPVPLGIATPNQGGTAARDCPDCTCEFVTPGYYECKDKNGTRWICGANKKNCENVPRQQSVPLKRAKPPVAPLTPQKTPLR